MNRELELQDNPGLANWDRLKKNREVFDKGEVQEELLFEPVRLGKTGYTGGPKIKILGDFEYVTAGGKSRSFQKTSLFTWTSKMSCPSFSIPAGPVKSHGTCPAATMAAIEKGGSYQEYSPSLSSIPPGQKFICDLCYAGKGRYLMYKSMSIGQVAKKKWVNKTLLSGTFTRRMSEAIASLNDPDVEKVLAAKLVSNQYFRIHDSGDFFSPEYYKAWVEVCHALPNVKFWAPTRMWVYDNYRQVFENYPPPRNLALRPSALFTSAPPPNIPGFAGGSTSIEGRMDDPIWNCPAYEGDEEHSCAAAGCRVCWTAQKKPVNYMTH